MRRWKEEEGDAGSWRYGRRWGSPGPSAHGGFDTSRRITFRPCLVNPPPKGIGGDFGLWGIKSTSIPANPLQIHLKPNKASGYPGLSSPDQSFANDTLASVLVLVRTTSHMLAVDPLPDGLLHLLHAHFTWLLHHVRGLSIRERRTTAGLECLLYLRLIGYKAAYPYFTGFLLMKYFAAFFIIFRRMSQCLLVLCEQLNFVEEDDIHSLHGTLKTNYTMFKRFHGTMQVAALSFIMVYMRADDTPDNCWF